MMSDYPRYTMRISKPLLEKLHYISRYEGRTANKQLEQLVKRCVKEFEQVNGEITDEMIQDMYSNK